LFKDQGDYAMWGPGIDHLWHTEKDCIVITVRWPSHAHWRKGESSSRE
jgi:hypothetical protein